MIIGSGDASHDQNIISLTRDSMLFDVIYKIYSKGVESCGWAAKHIINNNFLFPISKEPLHPL